MKEQSVFIDVNKIANMGHDIAVMKQAFLCIISMIKEDPTGKCYRVWQFPFKDSELNDLLDATFHELKDKLQSIK